MEFLILKLLISKLIKDNISEQSIASDNDLFRNIKSKIKQQLLTRVRLRKFKTISFKTLSY